MFFSVLCLLSLGARLFVCALWWPVLRGLTSCSDCGFVAFPLVSWVGCGT